MCKLPFSYKGIHKLEGFLDVVCPVDEVEAREELEHLQQAEKEARKELREEKSLWQPKLAF